MGSSQGHMSADFLDFVTMTLKRGCLISREYSRKRTPTELDVTLSKVTQSEKAAPFAARSDR